jgi:hypothetical protein
VQASRSIGDGRETRDGVIQDEPVLGAKHFIAHEGSTGLKAAKSTVLCQCLVISVISPNGSDRLLDAFRRYRISRYCGPPTIDRGSTIFGADNMKYRTNGSAVWIQRPLEKRKGLCIAEAHPVWSFPNAKHQCDGREYAEIKKVECDSPCVNKKCIILQSRQVQISSIIRA